jgi:hypothetical protein
VPEWLLDSVAYANAELPRLRDEAAATALPQRVIVVSHEQGPQRPLLQWPLSATPPETIALSELEATEVDFGDGVLIDGDDADGVRAVRETIAGFSPAAPAAFLWHSAEAQPPEYRMYMRDAIPWEDANGIIPLP